MGKVKKPKCVMILTEGPSDRAALTAFFTDLYSMIDEDIEVFFPRLIEEEIDDDGNIERNFNGDITSRTGIKPENILPLLLKLFIHPELLKHSAYIYPSEIHEVIHIVDIDGTYIDDSKVVNVDNEDFTHLPYYDIQANRIVSKNREDTISRNERKRNNLKRLVDAKRLRITIRKEDNTYKEKPYRVFYFSSNLDNVLFDKANNEHFNKCSDAREFSNDFYDEPLKLARYFIDHPYAVGANNYKESWELIMNDTESLRPRTNINILVADLLRQAKIPIEKLPENDIRPHFK